MRRLGDVLVGGRAITADALERALMRQRQIKGRLGTNLLEAGALTEDLLLRALSVQRRVPPALASDLAAIRPDIIRLVPAKLAQRLGVIPFRRNGRAILLAMRDPNDLPAVDEVSFLTGLPVTPHVALDVRLDQALHKYYGVEPDIRSRTLVSRLDGLAVPPASATGLPAAGSSAPGAVQPVPAVFVAPRPVPLPAPPVPPPPPPSIHGRIREEIRAEDVHTTSDPWGDASDPRHPVLEPSLVTDRFEVPTKKAPATPVPSPAPSAPPTPPPAPAHPAESKTLPTPQVEALDDEDLRRLRGEGPQAELEVVESSVTAPDVSTSPVPGEPPAPGTKAEAAAETEVEDMPTEPAAADLVDRLARIDERDEIADLVLGAASEHVKHAAFFICQPDRVIGWAARPEPPKGLRSFSLKHASTSVFSTIRNTTGFFSGPAPDTEGNRSLLAAVGAAHPAKTIAVPVTLKGKSVLFLVGVEPTDKDANPVPQMRRLAGMTALALEILLLRNKLRNL